MIISTELFSEDAFTIPSVRPGLRATPMQKRIAATAPPFLRRQFLLNLILPFQREQIHYIYYFSIKKTKNLTIKNIPMLSTGQSLIFFPTEIYLKEQKNFKTCKGRRTKVSKTIFEIFLFLLFCKKTPEYIRRKKSHERNNKMV